MKVNPDVYTVGGTVQAGSGVYISRTADEELLALCRASVYTYVLTPRQMGKSSLMIRTAQQLALENIKSAYVDLTKIVEKDITADQFYLGILTILRSRLKLRINVVEWWKARQEFSRPQRFTDFIEEIVLTEIHEPVVIFIDEIDKTIGLDFSDDFFASIRSLFQDRTRLAQLRRISFVLVGVATPSDLIKDEKTTPFNIGKRVELSDFTTEEGRPLIAGLGLPEESAIKVLENVYKWTNGHPYLTQRLFRTLVDENPANWTESEIDSITAETFFGEESEKDNNLQFVRDMLTHSDRVADSESILTTYREILREETPVYNDEQSVVISHLKLSGVVCNKGSVLQVRNEIYRQVFNEEWTKKHLPINWKRRLTKVAGIAGIIFLLGLIPVTIFALFSRNDALTARTDAEVERNNAVAARNDAVAAQAEEQKQRKEAETQREEAKTQKERADYERDEAVKAKNELAQALTNEKDAKDLAEARRKEAELATANERIARNQAEERRKEAELATANERVNKEKAIVQTEQANKFRKIAQTIPFLIQSQSLLKSDPESSLLLANEALKIAENSKNEKFENRIFPADLNVEDILFNGMQALPILASEPISVREFKYDDEVISAFPDYRNDVFTITNSNKVFVHHLNDFPNITNDNPEEKTEIIYPSKIVKTFKGSNISSNFLITLNDDGKLYVVNLGYYDGNVANSFRKELNKDNEKTLWQTINVGNGVNDVAANYKTIAVADGRKLKFFKIEDNLISEDGTINENITSVSFSHDGKYFATISDQGLKLWQADYKQQADAIEVNLQNNLVRFAPKDKYLFTVSFANQEIKKFKLDKTIEGEDTVQPEETNFEQADKEWGEITDFNFSPDSRYILTTYLNGTVNIGEVSSGKKKATFRHKSKVNSAVFSEDGKYVITASDNKTVQIWDITAKRDFLGNHFSYADFLEGSPFYYQYAAAFNRNTKLLAVYWEEDTPLLKVADINNKKPEISIPVKDFSVKSLAFSDDGTLLGVGNDKGVRIFEPVSGKQIKAIDFDEKIKSNFKANEFFEFNSDATKILVFSNSNSASSNTNAVGNKNAVSIIDVATQKTISFKLSDNFLITKALFNPSDKSQVAVVGYSEDSDVIEIWSIKNPIQPIRLWQVERTDVSDISYSPNGKYLGILSDSTLNIYNSQNGSTLAVMPFNDEENAKVISWSEGSDFIAVLGDGESLIFSLSDSNDLQLRRYAKLNYVDRTLQSGGQIAFLQSFVSEKDGDSKYLILFGRGVAQKFLWKTEDLLNNTCQRLTRNLIQSEYAGYANLINGEFIDPCSEK